MTLPDPCIELAVYRCHADTLLFVPAVCRPPREAETAFGPLSHAGSVHVPKQDGPWTAILAQLDRHLFATVPREQGEMLIGTAPTAFGEAAPPPA